MDQVHPVRLFFLLEVVQLSGCACQEVIPKTSELLLELPETSLDLEAIGVQPDDCLRAKTCIRRCEDALSSIFIDNENEAHLLIDALPPRADQWTDIESRGCRHIASCSSR